MKERKNKYDFIQEILESKKLTAAQRERVLMLSQEELRKENLETQELIERVRKIEKIVFLNKGGGQLENTPTAVTSVKNPKYIGSENLYRFLYDFNQNTILKTACHEIDSNELNNILKFCGTEVYDFISHRKLIQKEYNTSFFNNKKYFVDHKVKNLILAYLTGNTFSKQNTAWTDEKILLNWNSKELDEWCTQNPTCVPHADKGLRKQQKNREFKFKKPIPSKLIKSKNIQYFSELVLHFKYLFHLRSDNSLYGIIEHINKLYKWDQLINFYLNEETFPRTIEMFTNVEKLIQTYKTLISLILEVVEKNSLIKPEITLTLKERESSIEFSILHTDSTFQKTLQNTLERNGSKFDDLIKNQINGLCDFYLKANFGKDGCNEVNIWNGKPKAAKPLTDFSGGVEYLLIFRK